MPCKQAWHDISSYAVGLPLPLNRRTGKKAFRESVLLREAEIRERRSKEEWSG